MAVAAAPFPDAIRVGRDVYVGCQSAGDGLGSIESQTADAFEHLVGALDAAGARMEDLVNLRTYYVYDGADGPEVTQYWNRMTAVRLRYLTNPGPAATAVRVRGVPAATQLIGVDGIAALNADRQRIMPAHAWDWTVPTPFSQGWRVGDKIYVGGQISADRDGKAMAVGDIAAQTRHTLDYIRHVLADGGQDWRDVATLRVCFKHDGDTLAARAVLSAIIDVVRDTIPAPRPSVTAFGVNLLYEGLLLEIDAVARAGGKSAVVPPGSGDWVALDGFSLACQAGNELHVGGLSAPGGASLAAQLEASLERLLTVVGEAGFDPTDLVKVTAFFVPEGNEAACAADRALILDTVQHYLPAPRPVLTVLAVPGLPHDGQRFQIDGVAARGADRVSFSLNDGVSA